MSISDSERASLGEQIRRQRERQYGTKKAAYQAAEVNAATWDKAELGEPVRGDLLRRIVRTLWPETEGDWTLIGAAPNVPPSLEDRVAELERLIRQLAGEPPQPPHQDPPVTNTGQGVDSA
jgi:hypothetical protein